MSRLKKILLFFVVLSIFYLVGPKWPVPVLDNQPLDIGTLSISNIVKQVQDQETAVANLKANNEAEIVWANDSSQLQTEYSFVYLPGFGASKGEGEPIHRDIAKRYGMNLYLARLEKQGIVEQEPFLDLKEEKLVLSAKEAIRAGKVLGKKVILLCCSTGATLGLYLAANDSDIAGVVSYSPNMDLADPTSNLLTMPWGLHLARLFMWSNYRGFEADEEVKKWWINHYRIEGVVALKSLVQNTMTDAIFKSIKQPVYFAYYYKSETEKDDLISISRIQEAFDLLATPAAQKRIAALADVSGHCMVSKFHSTNEQLEVIRKGSFDFLEEVMGLVPN